MEKKLASVITSTSRLATWESSWAKTPSISCGSSPPHRTPRPGHPAGLGPPPEALRDGHRSVLRTAAGCKGVRDIGRDDSNPRLREVGHRAEALDHGVELRSLVGGDDFRA